jgi:hypothetical protein
MQNSMATNHLNTLGPRSIDPSARAAAYRRGVVVTVDTIHVPNQIGFDKAIRL